MYIISYLLGAGTVAVVWAIASWIKKNKVRPAWYSWFGLIFSGLLFLFTIAWVASSFYEGEVQAARVGLILFGGPVILIFGLTRRKIIKDLRKEKSAGE